jgi:hypothetical protein
LYRYTSSAASNLTFEVGAPNGVYEWNYTGVLNESVSKQTATSFNVSLATALSTCTADSNGYCMIPLHLTSNTAGNVTLSDLLINYTSSYNPITLNLSLIQAFFLASTNYSNLPLTFSVSSAANLTVSALSSRYLGGNYSLQVFSRYNNTLNDTLNITYYYSDWNYSFPSYTSAIEFIPRTPTTANVSAHSQKGTTPILNITALNTGGKTLNFSMLMINSTNVSCINISVSTTPYRNQSTALSPSWLTLKTNKSYGNNFGLWMWADYNCNYTSWKVWQPTFYFRTCCESCVCSEAYA